ARISRPTFAEHARDPPVRRMADVAGRRTRYANGDGSDELSSYCLDGGRVGRSVHRQCLLVRRQLWKLRRLQHVCFELRQLRWFQRRLRQPWWLLRWLPGPSFLARLLRQLRWLVVWLPELRL